MKRIAIIGGGTSGLFCSIFIKKWCPDYEVVILERLEKVGKKILATGNGRCNFSNLNLDINKYNNPFFVNSILKKFDVDKLRNTLEELGLLSIVDNEGRLYPFSESANSFLDILRSNLKNLSVIEKTNFEVNHITKLAVSNTYLIEDTRKQKLEANYCIIATGGKSNPILGSNGSGYNLLKPFKVKITDVLPGLVGIKVDPFSIKGLSGIRLKAEVNLYDKKTKKKLWSEKGEVLFKDDGLSGIVVMQLATMISRYTLLNKHQSFAIELDLMSNYSEEELMSILLKRKSNFKNFECSDFLNGIFNKILGFNIIKKSKLDLSQYIDDLTDRDILRLIKTIKNYPISYTGLYGFERSQVTIGGIELSEINKATLELYKSPDLYVCGEIINIDGECGGYNMHFALASAYVVASAIREKCENNE